ncbi:MAG: SH3 domain-containing protein, partial [Actinomycetota bacterium]
DVPAGLELRVRELPGTDQDILFTLPNGTIVPTTGERALIGGTVWLEVRLDGTLGWSSSTYLTATSTTVEAPASPTLPGVTALDAVDAGTFEVTDVPAGLELRVRANPGIGQAIITTLANGTIVRTTGERAQVGETVWLQVDLGGTLGWSSSFYLTSTTLSDEAPATPAEPTDDPTGPGVVVLNTVASGTYQVTDVPSGLQLRVRSNPGVGNPQIDLLADGTVVSTTGRRAQVGDTIWLEVQTDDATGWSSSRYLTEQTEVVTAFAELVPEGEIDAVITLVAVDEDDDDISVRIGDDVMAVSETARILDADGRLLNHLSWADQRRDVSTSNPLIAEVTVEDGMVVELRQTAMI